MFGFLIGGVVNDDAVKLKTFTDMALNKYRALSTAELGAEIEKEFDEEHFHVGTHTVNFRFKELEYFLFMFESFMEEEKPRNLTVVGKGRYAGFMLQVVDGDKWFCSVSDGIAYRATGGAKKLVQVMEKKFGVQNFTKLMKGFW